MRRNCVLLFSAAAVAAVSATNAAVAVEACQNDKTWKTPKGVGCGELTSKKKCKKQTGCKWKKKACKDDKAKSCIDLFKKYDKKKEQGKMKQKDEKKVSKLCDKEKDAAKIKASAACRASCGTCPATPRPTPESTPRPTPEPTPRPTPELTPAPSYSPTPAPSPRPTTWSYSYSWGDDYNYGALEGDDFTCEDSTTWSVKNRKGKTITCKKVRRSKILENGERRRCSLKGAREACAKSCGTC